MASRVYSVRDQGIFRQRKSRAKALVLSGLVGWGGEPNNSEENGGRPMGMKQQEE